jgi:hypothetical protein
MPDGGETMKLKARSIFLAAMLMALVASAALAASASASPAWKFEGKELLGNETALASTTALSMTIPGLTTTCESSLSMTIWNSMGTAKGEVVKGSLFDSCFTNSKFCTVESTAFEVLPWALRGVYVSTTPYVVIEGIRFSILYGGEECVLGGVVAKVSGTAGGLFDNATSSITFNAASFSATKTKLTVFGSSIEWKGVFPIKATGPGSGATLTLS